MFSIAVGPYLIRCQDNGLPGVFDALRKRAALVVDEPSSAGSRVPRCFVSVERGENTLLVVAQPCDPGPDAGFHPGLAIVPETHVLFFGAGCVTRAFDLSTPRMLWQDSAESGFWGWAQHDDVVLMSAELELAAWDIHGRKLWTTFVEPPWCYMVASGEVRLDVMGKVSTFPISRGAEDK